MTQQRLLHLLGLVLFLQAVLFPHPTHQQQQTQTATTTLTMVTPTTSSNLTTTPTTSATATKSSWASNDVLLEFDESYVQNLNLKLKWRFTNSGANATTPIPTRFVLLMETKRINFSTFLFDYSSPQLIDDEQVWDYFVSVVVNFILILISRFVMHE